MQEQEAALARTLTLRAFPTYCVLPCSALALDGLGAFPASCDWLTVLVYLFLLEFCVFLDHYYMLHKWKHFRHDVHHFFKKRIDAWASFAFYPFDGLSQGLPALYVALLVPVTARVVYTTIAVIGAWTIFIHTNTGIRVPFLLGYEYHAVHHAKGWYNFGLFTKTFDVLFKTLREPDDD